MSALAYLLDTNILLRLSLPGGPYDEVVVSAVGRLVAEEQRFSTRFKTRRSFGACARALGNEMV
jgi:hypothetical protein